MSVPEPEELSSGFHCSLTVTNNPASFCSAANRPSGRWNKARVSVPRLPCGVQMIYERPIDFVRNRAGMPQAHQPAMLGIV